MLQIAQKLLDLDKKFCKNEAIDGIVRRPLCRLSHVGGGVLALDGIREGYMEALLRAIASQDKPCEVEVLKSLGDISLHVGRKSNNVEEVKKAGRLYSAALRRCEDKVVRESLEQSLKFVDRCDTLLVTDEGNLVQKTNPENEREMTMSKVSEMLCSVDIQQTANFHAVRKRYASTLMSAIISNSTLLEVETLKGIGDIILEKGKVTQSTAILAEAVGLYREALNRCEDEDGQEVLRHRIGHTEKVKEQMSVRQARRSLSGKPDMEKTKTKQSAEVEDKTFTSPFASLQADRDPIRKRIMSGKSARPIHTRDAQKSDKTGEDTNSAYKDHLQEGCMTLHTGDLDRAEQEYAAALASVHVKGQHKEEAEPLYKLGDIYLRRGMQSKDGGDFTKAAALCNAALVRYKREDITKCILKIPRLFVKHVLGVERVIDMGDKGKHKMVLENHRSHVEKEIKRMEEEMDPYSLDDDDPKMREVEKKRAEAVKVLFQTIVHQRNTFVAALVDECIEVMGPPPCKYAMIGLGSQATGLVTPYSDLEFAILIEEETETNVTYFRNLTHYLHLKVINLEETILPAMAIKSLNDFNSEDPLGSWFYDSVTPRGFSFDGAMPHACKTPLGRGKEGTVRNELIQTPRQMASVLKDDIEIHFKKGYHLASVLGNVCLMSGDQDMVNVYTSLWTQYLQKKEGTIPLLIAEADLIDNARMFEDRTLTASLLNVKKEIYRFSSLAVACLALLHNIQPTTIWETIEKLENSGVIDSENAHHLIVLVSISAELRLRTYMNNRGQVESMSALSSMSIDTDIEEKLRKVFYFSNTKQLMRYYYTARPLKHFISHLADSQSQKEPPILFDNSSRLEAEVYESVCDYQHSKTCMERTLQNDLVTYGSRGVHPRIAETLAGLGHACAALGDHVEALNYHKQSLQMKRSIYGEASEHQDILASVNALGNVYRDLANYRTAVSYHEQCLQMMRSIYGEDSVHPDIATTLDSLGLDWSRLADHRNAAVHHEQSLEMRLSIYGKNTAHPAIGVSLNNLGATWSDLGDHRKAIEYHEKALQMWRSIYGESTAHPDIAASLHNLGGAWKELGDHKTAVSYYELSLQMSSIIFGANTAHPDIAQLLNNLGAVWTGLGDNRKAIYYHEWSLQMWRRIYGDRTAKHDIAAPLVNLGSAWMGLGDYRNAIRYHEQALQMWRSIFGETSAHPRIAAALTNLGSDWLGLEDHEKAISYYEQSLQMNLIIYGEGVAHPDIAGLLSNLGTAWKALGDHEKAVSYHEQSLKMRRSIYGETTPHPDIASSLDSLGASLGHLGDRRGAVSYHEDSLKMMRSILGETTAHPSIAGSLYNLGISCTEIGDYRKAVSYFEESLQMRRILYGEGNAHPHIADSLTGLAVCWKKLGDPGKTLNYSYQASRMKYTIFGPDKLRSDIAKCLKDSKR